MRFLVIAFLFIDMYNYFQNPSIGVSDEDNQCFESLGLKKDILTEIYKLNFENPTNIQVRIFVVEICGISTK